MGRRGGVSVVRLEKVDETTFRVRPCRTGIVRTDAVRFRRLSRSETEASRFRVRLLPRTLM